ncbi:hypothetical protein Y032_0431g1332 [Ancylostoma ceylanicum]|uniref:Uncharacterized protein n=1 Tax=Ancylostoma ceylanicum TaxID=53326 RepID=A0A016X1G1_9BILA|nr:hypothetical protein Y032_0431g1332 [Ancylostoma ceylanicum]
MCVNRSYVVLCTVTFCFDPLWAFSFLANPANLGPAKNLQLFSLKLCVCIIVRENGAWYCFAIGWFKSSPAHYG